MADYMLIFRSNPDARRNAMGTPEAAQRSLQAWLGWIRDLETRGALASRGQPLEVEGKVVRGKARAVTDGPYVEAKDLVLGFIIVRAKDLAEATEHAKGCPMLEGDGAVEVRPVASFGA